MRKRSSLIAAAGILAMLATTLAGRVHAVPPAPAPATETAAATAAATATAPAASSAPAALEALIRQLGAADYAQRESAQDRLTALGEAATDALLAHLGDRDPEIANRIEVVLCNASGADLRARVAVGLIETAKPDLVAKAAWMLFQDAEASIAPFRKAAARHGGRAAVAAPIILSQLESFVDYAKRARELEKKSAAKHPAIAAQQPRNIEDQRRGLCFVAGEEAADAVCRKAVSTAASSPRSTGDD